MLRRTIRQNAVLAETGDINGPAQCSVEAARTVQATGRVQPISQEENE